MYEGYLAVNGTTEVLNAGRTKVYASKFMPALDFKCDENVLEVLAPAGDYDSPASDGAPWYYSGTPESGDFYGFFPSKVEGGSDSTYTLSATELIGDGAVFGTSRHKSLETRWTVVGLAKTEAAMEHGMTWLRKVLEESSAPVIQGGCSQMTALTLRAAPKSEAQMGLYLRTHYDVGLLVPPTVTVKTRSASGLAWHVTFTLRAGNPSAYTGLMWSLLQQMNTGYTAHSDPAGQDCSLQNASYANFINDPFYTAISLPPQPPVIKPPNLLPITSWRRKLINIPSEYSAPGSIPTLSLSVSAGPSAVRQLRARIYDASKPLNACPSLGEFYVSYLPAGSTMTIDGVRKQVTVSMAVGGNTVITSGSHLVFGSDGNPFTWPKMDDSGKSYTIALDLMPPSAGVNQGPTVSASIYLKES